MYTTGWRREEAGHLTSRGGGSSWEVSLGMEKTEVGPGVEAAIRLLPRPTKAEAGGSGAREKSLGLIQNSIRDRRGVHAQSV